MFFKRLLNFSEDQKIDIAALKLQLGEFEEAYNMLRDIVAKQSKMDSLSYKLALSIFSKSGIRHAKKLEQNGNLTEALDIYSSINEIAPAFPDIHNSIASLKISLKDLYSAKEHLMKALDINPNYKDAILNLIRLYVTEEQYDEAEKETERLGRLAEGKEEELVAGLKKRLGERNKEQIFQMLRDIMQNKDDYTSLYLRLGIELFNKQRYKEAVPELQKYLQYKPKYADVMHILGVCYMELKDYQSAIDSFLGCLSVNKEFVLSRLHLAMSYKEIGKHEEAEREFSKVLESDPKNKIAKRFLEEINSEGN